MSDRFFSRFFKARLGNLEVTVSLNDRFERLSDAPRESGEEHFHAQYEIFFAGEIPLEIVVAGTPLRLCRAALCLPPFTPHVVRRREQVYCFCFEIRQTSGAEGDDSVYAVMRALLSDPTRPLAMSEDIYGDLHRLVTAYHTTSSLGEEMASALLRLVFFDLYESNAALTGEDEVASIHDYCTVIDQFIYTRYTERITLSTVAEALHLSTKQVSRIIRKKYRATLSGLLTEKRLQVAAQLLCDTDRSVSEIAATLFGRSNRYFYRLFSEKYGCSPLAYRKAAQK